MYPNNDMSLPFTIAIICMIIGALLIIAGILIRMDEFNKPAVILLGIIVVVGSGIALLVFSDFNHTQKQLSELRKGPNIRIKEKYKNQACRENILRALESLKEKKGLLYNVEVTDPQEIFDKGHVKKNYGRDGVEITCAFGLQVVNGECNLLFYQRESYGFGTQNTEWGNFGTAPLENCQCDSI